MTPAVAAHDAPASQGPDSQPSVLRIAAIVLAVGMLGAVCWAAVQSRIATGDPVVTAEVVLLLNDFSPDAILVPAGTTVTWRFEGGVTHNIVGDGWGTPDRTEGAFTHSFSSPGTYDYRCTLHGPMRGRVTVDAARVS